jgi:hypothetical protein
MKCGMEIGWYVAAMVDEIAKAWMEGAWGYLNQRDRGQLMGAPGNTKLKSLGQCRRHPYSGDWGTNLPVGTLVGTYFLFLRVRRNVPHVVGYIFRA